MTTSRLLTLFALISGAVVAQSVKYDYDAQANFAQYKSYRWAQHPDSLQLDQLTLRQLGQAFDTELAKKGLKRVDGEAADLVIVYQFATSEEKELTTFDTGYAYGRYWRGGMGTSTTTVSTITNGTIALDVYDANAKLMVWRGVATKSLDPKANKEKRQKAMAKAAEKMLKNFPPPKK